MVPGYVFSLLMIYAMGICVADSLRCIVSRRECDVTSNCTLRHDIDVCDSDVNNVIETFCMAAGRENQTFARGCFIGLSTMTHCRSNSCDIQPRLGPTFTCCCKADLCNLPPEGFIPTYPPVADPVDGGLSALEVFSIVFILLILAAIGLLVYIGLFRPSRRRDHGHENPLVDSADTQHDHSHSWPTAADYLRGQVVLEENRKSVSGGFGRVYKGRFTNLDGVSSCVAIKVFNKEKAQSWQVEWGFYTSAKMSSSPESVLRYEGALVVEEEEEEAGAAQYWLVTEYHHLGSLRDYLLSELLTLHQVLIMVEGLADAVNFLHALDPYPVAHRDIKSHNVLVKNNRTICLADFGLSLSFNRPVANQDRTQTGTPLYMAPEMLQSAIDDFTAHNFLPVDVYALGLVLWEIVSRCSSISGPVGPYRPPYTLELGEHPDVHMIRHHVAELGERPVFQPQWLTNPVLNSLCETISNCWDREPEERIKAGTVLARVTEMLQETYISKPPQIVSGGSCVVDLTCKHNGVPQVTVNIDNQLQETGATPELSLQVENSLSEASHRVDNDHDEVIHIGDSRGEEFLEGL